MARTHHPRRSLLRGRGYFRRFGPGLISGAAADDPSGIGTYSQVGAAQGAALLWTAPVILPFAFAVQEACARLGLVSGTGLAGVIKQRLPRSVLLITVAIVAIANTVNIAADLASMAAAIQLILPVPQVVGVVAFALGVAVSEILIPYQRYSRALRWLCLSLLAYVGVLVVVRLDWGVILRSTFIPAISFDRATITALIAIAGTTISPYLFFWQAAEEAEDEAGRPQDLSAEHMQSMRGDVFAGMASAIIVMFAIMATAAATLHVNGITDVATAEQAASALTPIAGEFAGLLFLLGIVGTGLLAVPVLAGSTAYAVSETMGWSESQGHRPRIFSVVIAGSMLVALLINASGIEPIRFLFIAAVLNGLVSPILLLVVWRLARDPVTMGRWVSGRLSQATLLVAALAMIALPVCWLLAR